MAQSTRLATLSKNAYAVCGLLVGIPYFDQWSKSIKNEESRELASSGNAILTCILFAQIDPAIDRFEQQRSQDTTQAKT